MTSPTVKDALIAALDRSRRFNKASEIAPIAVLWPDGASQWASVVPHLRDRLTILTLGEYDTETLTGPAIWIRAELARRADDAEIPIVYLPGFSKDDLRHIDDAPKTIEPLAYLQYRGEMFLQYNGKDWTIPAFFQNAQYGLGVDVDQSQATRSGLVSSATQLLSRSVDDLKSHVGGIDASFLGSLLVPDQPRQILDWINHADAMRRPLAPEVWDAFSAILRSRYGVDPDKDGVLAAARRLGDSGSDPNWDAVWNRYTEAPQNYANIPNLLRSAKPNSVTQRGLFDSPDLSYRWPQDNEAAEADLRKALLELNPNDAQGARQKVAKLESKHAVRRGSVWCRLGHADLAVAVEHLAAIASGAAEPFPAGDVQAMQQAYTERGWKIDAAAIDAIRCVESIADQNAVNTALGAIYTPWLWKVANDFQEALVRTYSYGQPSALTMPGGTCVLFADGLRFDLGARLKPSLEGKSLAADLSSSIAPLPGITSSAKPAQSPVVDLLTAGDKLTVKVRQTGVQLSQSSFTKLLHQAGWQFIGPEATGKPAPDALGWTEFGNIDSYGHGQPRDLAKQTVREVDKLSQRIEALLAAGWHQVRVITDHGWLLTPAPMEKTDLPVHLTVEKKGRCARIDGSSAGNLQTLPWVWDPEVRIAFAPGISCFEGGKRYDHGGLSLQESVIPELIVTAADAPVARGGVIIAEIRWRGLRCTVDLAGSTDDMSVDIRMRAGDAGTSIVMSPGRVEHELARVVASDDIYEGRQAELVALDANGTPVAQQTIVVGGE